jgi:hypothetical protein
VNLSARPRQNPQAAWRDLTGQVFLILPQANEVHELNETGTFLWVRADGRRTVAELAEDLAQEFDVEPGAAQTDAAQFFAELEHKHLVLSEAGG